MDFFSFIPFVNTWFVLCVTVLFLIYRLGTINFRYFSKQGIPGPKPMPFVGNLWGFWKANAPKNDMQLIKKYGKVFGTFDGRKPNLFVADHELIRLILVRDFDHFINRRSFNLKSKYVRKMLTAVRDQEWKNVRSSVSPAFTTGKIKKMSTLIVECADRLSQKLETLAANDGKLDVKKHFNAFTMDVIARCAFGMRIESLGENDDPFTKNAATFFNAQVNSSPILLVPFLLPELNSLYADTLFITKEFQFFLDTLKNLVNERAQSKDKFNDFVDIATEAILQIVQEQSESSGIKWNREEIDEVVIAQSVLFLLAGYDTTATTLSNSCYLLAKHPDIQEKLHKIIMDRMEQFGEINHEFILDMPYITNFINEVLRLFPPALRLERECSKDVVYDGIHIQKGTVVSIPVYALHHMEEYYPDPEKFDPDRWIPENKGVTSQYTFLPFGMGPRNCVGMRFAMEELKIVLCTMLKDFRFFPVEETADTLEIQDGFWMIVHPKPPIVGIESRK